MLLGHDADLQTLRLWLWLASRAPLRVQGEREYAVGPLELAAEGLVGPAQVEWLDRVREDLES